MAVKDVCKKHKSLIRHLGIHAPLEERERFNFFRGAEVALDGYIEMEEIRVIVNEAEALSADLWDDNDD